ncbi:cell division protein FtsA [bacterium BMS3Bbin06]|nr:cell division protein FtsA [bacterium BMS3Abin08]GBE34346.1 cell division protein FtsA [bacterium BMS3Bbin06]HDO35136.1 cell division protein FtsA [Nitrospirota bacterium]HDY71331.1 cell division protein FtsA [Nitrospirota bacterium]
MSNGQFIVGLDVGTTKICVIVGQYLNERMDVVAVGSAPSMGLRKGIVVNIESTMESIRNATKDAERASGIEINSVYVGIAGGHIKGFASYGAVGIKGGEVSSDDIERALDAAKAVYVPLDREVLHVIPLEYVVDGEEGIMNPVGMSGVRLESRVQIVTGSVSAVQNLIRCCERANVQVNDIVLEPLASSLSTLTDDEKAQGVVLVDVGGGTTDIALYKNGVLTHTSVIAVGGNHITNDIAIGLRLPVHEAERVKMEYGTAIMNGTGSDKEIQIMVAGRDARTIPRHYVTEIIAPRCEELFDLIKNELVSCGAYDEASYGLVITGGASQMEGFSTLAEAVLGLPVRIGRPANIDGLKNIIDDPRYATGVGLLLYGAEHELSPIVYGDIFSNILKKMKGWVKGFLKIRS